MVTHSDLVLLGLVFILSSSGSYRNNNNVIVVHSKVERMKGEASISIIVAASKINFANLII